MNTAITLTLNAGEGNPRNSEGSFVTLKICIRRATLKEQL
jgi:hypothetical protein